MVAGAGCVDVWGREMFLLAKFSKCKQKKKKKKKKKKNSIISFAHCVDSEDKLYTFCTLCLHGLFTFHVYLNAINYQVAAGHITWAREGHNLRKFTFLCHFLNRKSLKR